MLTIAFDQVRSQVTSSGCLTNHHPFIFADWDSFKISNFSSLNNGADAHKVLQLREILLKGSMNKLVYSQLCQI